MKKTIIKVLSVVLVVVISLTSAPLSGLVGLELPERLDFSIMSKASTVTGKCGDNLIWTYDTTTRTLTISGTGAMYDYEYNTQPWKSYRNSIKEINVKSGVKTIGDWAFCYCDSLTNITLPNSVTSIGKRAFQYCESLICITLPNSITKIDVGLFFGCTSITNITIPDSVTIIGDFAFSYCDSLTSVTIHDGVTSIGERALSDCTKLTSITVESNNEYYSSDEYGVLFNKDKTTLIQYPVGNTRTNYTIPDSITIIGACAFRSCESITSVAIPDSVITIGNVAFWCCTRLTSITIPDSVTIIGDFTFNGCDSLASITVPDSVTSIGGYAFNSCNSLTDVYYSGTEEHWKEISIDSYNEPFINATIHFNSVGRMASIVAECEVGDVIEFGSYPQSEVKDEELIVKLNSLDLNWVSYEYYIGTGDEYDGQMKPDNYMKYADVNYNANKYRAVTFTRYRPYLTGRTGLSGYRDQEENAYYTNAVYWFKYEPIEWCVLDPNEGLIICKTIIDSQAYNNTIYYNYSDNRDYQNTSCTTYANDYATSSIRDWINNDFYNVAFTYSEKNEIKKSILNNDCPYNDAYDSDQTIDKLFLLSYDEAKNSNYGFSSSSGSSDKARRAKGTDYAKAQGLYVYSYSSYYGNSLWWLRSSYDISRDACGVDEDGCSGYFNNVSCTSMGVRPALKFNPKNEAKECEHEYVSKVTIPTCTEQGCTTNTCSVCGDAYTDNYVDALGHTDGDIVEENYVAPTCTANGSKDNVTYCAVCNTETSRETISIPALGHIEEEISAVQPTCTETGLTTGVKCSVCNEILESQQEVPALGHDIITDEAIAPDCTNTGLTAGEHCSRCDYKVEQTVVDALGHKYDSVITAPTCTSQGYTTYTCHCGDTYIGDYVDAVAHNYKDGICIDCETPDPTYFTFDIQQPSRTTVRCNDGIKLHTKITGKLTDGSRIEWTKNNNNFNMTTSASGNEITIISKNNGYTTFTATVYDADNNVIAQDTIEMYSKSGFFDKIGGFFRSLFGTTKIYEN